jgi:hypothetical protein
VSGELMRPGKRRENGEKEGGVVAVVTVLNWRTEVGVGRLGGATWRARAERGGADWWTVPGRQRPETGGHERRGAAMSCGRPTEQGRGKGADRWAVAIVPSGGTG